MSKLDHEISTLKATNIALSAEKSSLEDQVKQL